MGGKRSFLTVELDLVSGGEVERWTSSRVCCGGQLHITRSSRVSTCTSTYTNMNWVESSHARHVCTRVDSRLK